MEKVEEEVRVVEEMELQEGRWRRASEKMFFF